MGFGYAGFSTCLQWPDFDFYTFHKFYLSASGIHTVKIVNKEKIHHYHPAFHLFQRSLFALGESCM
jgi:hypothetical protein